MRLKADADTLVGKDFPQVLKAPAVKADCLHVKQGSDFRHLERHGVTINSLAGKGLQVAFRLPLEIRNAIFLCLVSQAVAG